MKIRQDKMQDSQLQKTWKWSSLIEYRQQFLRIFSIEKSETFPIWDMTWQEMKKFREKQIWGLIDELKTRCNH